MFCDEIDILECGAWVNMTIYNTVRVGVGVVRVGEVGWEVDS